MDRFGKVACDSCCIGGELDHVVPPSKNMYNPSTYIGNWYEETVRNTLRRDEFLKKRECGDLSIQRTQNMVDLLLKPVDLSASSDSYLHYGDKVQIMSPGPSCQLAVDAFPYKRNYCKISHLALSAAVPPEVIDHSEFLNTDSIISASPLLFPVVRNSFIIEHPTCATNVGAVINYGDVFRIRAFDTQRFPLYLFSAPGIRHHSLATHSGKPKVRFSDVKTADTLWTAYPLDDFEKLTIELGVPVPKKQKLLLKHNGSGHNLSTEPSYSLLTYFGCELEVTLDTKLDRKKRPSFENLWYFDTERLHATKDPQQKEFERQADFSAKINVNNMNRSSTTKDDDDCQLTNNYSTEDEPTAELPETNQQIQYPQNELINNFSQQSIRSNDGLRAYDPATAPQPHAHQYRVADNDPHFPNKKWGCWDTNCCAAPVNTEIPQESFPPCKQECECIETQPRKPNPNSPVEYSRLIQ